MSHKQIQTECEALGMHVHQNPSLSNSKAFVATHKDKGQVYWFTSSEYGLLGLPRFRDAQRDTHCRSLSEIRYLVRLANVKP